MKHYLLLAFICISIFSCQTKRNKVEEPYEKMEMIDSIKKVDSVISKNCIDTAYNDFDKFINKFNSDSLFQLGRIKFPLIYQHNDDMGDSLIIEYIKRTNWTHLDLKYDSVAYYREYDRYEQKIEKYNDSVIINLTGIDNGIQISYHFNFFDKNWYLVHYKDLSF